jgi:hypothetical protein
MEYAETLAETHEAEFLRYKKITSDGRDLQVDPRDLYDMLELDKRTDRILPNGWCLLPPLQTCGTGNACLTCAVYVTDHTHQEALQRQLADTAALIDRARGDFQQRHGRPMPDDNVWLAQRQSEHDALARVLAAMDNAPDRAVQGSGCPSAPPAGPVPVTIDIRKPPQEQP